MTAENDKDNTFFCSFVSIHYIICECGETFPSENALKLHLEKEHPHKRERKEYKCGVCGNIYNTEEECILHYEANHMKVELKSEESELEEELAEEEVYQEELIIEPEENESHNPAATNTCGQLANQSLKEMSYEEAESYVQAQEAEEVQNEEGEEVQNEEVEEGQIEEDEEVQNDGEIYAEDFDGQFEQSLVTVPDGTTIPLSDIPVYQRELLQVTADGQLVIYVNQDKPKKTKKPKVKTKDHICEMCGKHYASGAALRYHQRVHTGERPYRCHMCPKAFTMPLFLQIHVRTHTGERPYTCNMCPKTFSSRAALMRHDRVHTGEKPYACPMCDRHFTQSNSMKLHVTTVHLRQPAPYKSKSRRLREARGSGGGARGLRGQAAEASAAGDTVTAEQFIERGLEKYVLGPLKKNLKKMKTVVVENVKETVAQEDVKLEVVEYDDANYEVVYQN